VRITGERDHVLQAAIDHVASVHNVTRDDKLTQNVTKAVDNPPPPERYGTWAH
jgi:hypothetical protein